MVRSISIAATAAGIATAAVGTCAAQAVVSSPPPAPTFAFTRLVEKLPAGSTWATFKTGALCVVDNKLVADGGQKTLDIAPFEPIFIGELTKAGYRRAGGEETNLFASGAEQSASFEIGGVITNMDVTVCKRLGNAADMLLPGLSLLRRSAETKGTAIVELEWQVYSTTRREIVFKAPVKTVYEGVVGYNDSPYAFIVGAFADAARQLANAPEMKALRDAPLEPSESRTRIILNVGPARSIPLADVQGSVVLLSAGQSFGSGVLVSADGYLLTNAHVVDTAKSVTVRWSDGFESRGEVIRLHSQRDVALIKTDPHGRTPLTLLGTSVQAGQTVLAVGAPMDKQLQGTLTRGVVSANRILDGFSFIQSDVAVNPGNSGGPLIDERGRVVGLTVSGYRPSGTPIGVNFFIPIKDALDFLALDLPSAPAQSAAR